MSAPALPARTWTIGAWALSAVAVAWVIVVSPHAFRGYTTERVALRIASGDTYRDDFLKKIGDDLETSGGALCSERFLRNALIIRARLAEDALAGGEMDRVDGRFSDVEGSARDLLACSPGQSFAWLALYWARIQTGIRAADLVPFMRRSYETGPHELWVQVRRSALAGTAFDQLPVDLQDRAVTEFGEMIRAGAFGAAANVLMTSGVGARARFLQQVADLPEELRYRLARVLRLTNTDIEVPGLRRPDRPWR